MQKKARSTLNTVCFDELINLMQIIINNNKKKQTRDRKHCYFRK